MSMEMVVSFPSLKTMDINDYCHGHLMLTLMYECGIFHVVQLKKRPGDMFQLINVVSLCQHVIIKCVHQH
jgi:hypothetical protein